VRVARGRSDTLRHILHDDGRKLLPHRCRALGRTGGERGNRRRAAVRRWHESGATRLLRAEVVTIASSPSNNHTILDEGTAQDHDGHRRWDLICHRTFKCGHWGTLEKRPRGRWRQYRLTSASRA